MALVVLLRGANLGKRRFSPKAVEKALADLGLVNIGAAGTFVVRKRVAQAALRKRIEDELPFDPAPMVVATAKEVLAALAAGEDIKVAEGARRFATAMAKKASAKLPVEAPGIIVSKVAGRFALGVRRPLVETKGLYPNEVVEKAFDVEATTRDWPTMEKVSFLLNAENA